MIIALVLLLASLLTATRARLSKSNQHRHFLPNKKIFGMFSRQAHLFVVYIGTAEPFLPEQFDLCIN